MSAAKSVGVSGDSPGIGLGKADSGGNPPGVGDVSAVPAIALTGVDSPSTQSSTSRTILNFHMEVILPQAQTRSRTVLTVLSQHSPIMQLPLIEETPNASLPPDYRQCWHGP